MPVLRVCAPLLSLWVALSTASVRARSLGSQRVQGLLPWLQFWSALVFVLVVIMQCCTFSAQLNYTPPAIQPAKAFIEDEVARPPLVRDACASWLPTAASRAASPAYTCALPPPCGPQMVKVMFVMDVFLRAMTNSEIVQARLYGGVGVVMAFWLVFLVQVPYRTTPHHTIPYTPSRTHRPVLVEHMDLPVAASPLGGRSSLGRRSGTTSLRPSPRASRRRRTWRRPCSYGPS